MPRLYCSLLVVGGVLVGLAGCRYNPAKEPKDLPPVPDLQLTRVSDEARTAIENAQARLKQYPGDALLNGELAMQLHANRRFQEAAVMYERSRKIHPEVFRWQYYHGVVSSELNDVSEAAASFRRALELTPNEPSALLGLAELYFKSAEIAKSDTLIAEGEKTLDLLIETNPDYVHGPLLKAARLEEAGKLHEAIEIYKGLTEQNPGFGIPHHALARLYEQVGDPASAERQAALAQQSSSAGMSGQNRWMAAINRLNVTNLDHAGRAAMLLQRRLMGPASAEFELAVQADPENLDHRSNLVAIYGLMRKPEKAKEHYDAALRLGGDAGKVHLNMGTMLLGAGRLDEAEAAYHSALKADGTLVKATLGLGRIALHRKDHKQAENYIRQALSLEPLNPLIYSELSHVLSAQGRYGEAARALEKGVAYSEGRTAVQLLRSLAQVHEDAGDLEAARDALQRARAEAERSDSNVDLALIDAQLGEYEAAAHAR